MSNKELAKRIREVSDDLGVLNHVGAMIKELLGEFLIEMRDSGTDLTGPTIGLAVKEEDGSDSPAIRLRAWDVVRIVLGQTADLLEDRDG